jgi:hypothetical protein
MCVADRGRDVGQYKENGNNNKKITGEQCLVEEVVNCFVDIFRFVVFDVFINYQKKKKNTVCCWNQRKLVHSISVSQFHLVYLWICR